MESNLEKKNIYFAALGEQDGKLVHAKLTIDSVLQGTNFADFLSDLFGIAAVVSVGTIYDESEVVYANDVYLRKEEEVGSTKTV